MAVVALLRPWVTLVSPTLVAEGEDLPTSCWAVFGTNLQGRAVAVEVEMCLLQYNKKD